MDATIRVTLAQTDIVLGDTGENLRRAGAALVQARVDRSDLVVFPELSFSGYSLGRVEADIALPAADAELAPYLRPDDRMGVVVGFPEAGRVHTYNSAAYVEYGTQRHVHRKLYLPTYGGFEERKHFSPGQSLRAFDTEAGRVALLICNDMWQPMLPFLAVQDGARVLIVPANSSRHQFSGVTDIQEEWRTINRFHARMLGCWVVFVNRVGSEGDLRFWGGSHIVDPWGEIVYEAAADVPETATIEVDLDAVRRRRREIPLVKEARLGLLSREIERLTAEGGDL
jgi:predicted amidohydrolase